MGFQLNLHQQIGKYPHLRLIHAVIDDNDIKAAYLSRLNLPSGVLGLQTNLKETSIVKIACQVEATRIKSYS
jgi:hypothetical protein